MFESSASCLVCIALFYSKGAIIFKIFEKMYLCRTGYVSETPISSYVKFYQFRLKLNSYGLECEVTFCLI